VRDRGGDALGGFEKRIAARAHTLLMARCIGKVSVWGVCATVVWIGVRSDK